MMSLFFGTHKGAFQRSKFPAHITTHISYIWEVGSTSYLNYHLLTPHTTLSNKYAHKEFHITPKGKWLTDYCTTLSHYDCQLQSAGISSVSILASIMPTICTSMKLLVCSEFIIIKPKLITIWYQLTLLFTCCSL